MSKRILFCWSGGGFPGVDIHCGIWRALDDAGIHATANAGTSAGAIMAAFNSTGRSAADMEAIVRNLSDDDVRSERFLWKFRIPWISFFMNFGPVKVLLKKYLPVMFGLLEKPCYIFATNMKTGDAVQFGACRDEDLVPAVLASMAISGVFPPVNGLSDGGTSANLPWPANWQEFDEIYLLVAKRPLDYSRVDTMLSRLFYNFDLYLEDQMSDTIELARFAAGDRVKVIRPAVSSYTGMLRFNHQLIDDAYILSRRIIEGWKI
jgi:predicted acylesterase/phospholipase RssA